MKNNNALLFHRIVDQQKKLKIIERIQVMQKVGIKRAIFLCVS